MKSLSRNLSLCLNILNFTLGLESEKQNSAEAVHAPGSPRNVFNCDFILESPDFTSKQYLYLT